MSFRRYRDYGQGEFFVIFADTGAGGGDYCAAQFLSKTRLDVPTVYHSPESATVMTPLLHTELERIYDDTGIQPIVAYERNNGGVFEIERLSTLNRLQKYRVYTMKSIDSEGKLTDTGKLGWDTNSATRPKMLQDGKEFIDKQLIKIYDEPTVNEMFSFVTRRTPGGYRVEAEANAHDDLVMALLGAIQLFQTELPVLHDDYLAPTEEVFTDGFFV